MTAPRVSPSTGSTEPSAPSAAVLRLSPRVLLIDPIRMLPSLIVPLAGVLIAGGFSPASFGWAALGVVASVVFAVIRWATFTYTITDRRLELTRAFIGRSVRTIPLERIRGVDVTTPPMHRVLGLAVLKLDTGAGGDEQEGELDAVTVGEAERLRATLLADRTQAAADDLEQGRPAPPIREYARVPRSWLKYGPLSGAYLLTPFALLAGAVGLAFQWGEEFGVSQRAAWRIVEWLWDRPYLLVMAAALLVLAMPVLGWIMYALFNWNFTLSGRNGYLVAERGLINRRVVSLERARIRGYELGESLLERRFGVARLWAVVTGLGDSGTRGQLLPVTPRSFAESVAVEAVGPITTPLRRHPPQARRRRLFRAVAPWLMLAVVAFAFRLTVLGAVLLALAAVGVPLGLDRYRSLGHTFDGSRLSVRSGSVRRTQAVVERRAVVGWTIRQTWFQRKDAVLTVTAGVGAGKGGYSAVDTGEQQGVAFAAEVTPAWITPFLAPKPK